MLAYVLYTPVALALGVLFFYSARGALRGYGDGKLVPLALALGVALFGSLCLVLGIDAWWGRWAGVAVATAAVLPLLMPVVMMLASVLYGWMIGDPARWN